MVKRHDGFDGLHKTAGQGLSIDLPLIEIAVIIGFPVPSSECRDAFAEMLHTLDDLSSTASSAQNFSRIS